MIAVSLERRYYSQVIKHNPRMQLVDIITSQVLLTPCCPVMNSHQHPPCCVLVEDKRMCVIVDSLSDQSDQRWTRGWVSGKPA